MKEFKGFVNGVTYDNKKDYHEAVSKAVEAGEVNAHSEYIEVDEPKEPEKLYQLTKEDINEIKQFNKNYSEIKNLLSSDLKLPNFGTIFKYL